MGTSVSQNVAEEEQYSLAEILGIWLLAAAPMGALAWIAFPVLKDSVPMHPGIFLWVLMLAGLMAQLLPESRSEAAELSDKNSSPDSPSNKC